MRLPHFITSLALISLALLASATLTPASGQVINEAHQVLASDGAEFDNFGTHVAISGTTAIAGALGDDDNGFSSGSAYLFDTVTGTQIAKLLASDGEDDDLFGSSVAISGGTAIAGAKEDDDNGEDSGSAYLFDTAAGTGTIYETHKLLPSDGDASDIFGWSVAISGNTAVVGAYRDDDNGGSGSAYLFDTTTGTQFAKLIPSVGISGADFGYSVAISGDTVVVGAPWDIGTVSPGPLHGSAYLFDTTTGAQIAKLLPCDGAESDYFGHSVAISGNIAIVGAIYDDDDGDASGSAYLFDTTTGAQLAKLLPTTGAVGDRFGGRVAITGTTAIAGAPGDDDNGFSSGSAYLFDVAPPYGTPGGPYCFGDGTGTLCPCGNMSLPCAGEGCVNGTGAGALLSASGSNSVSADDLVLSATGLTPGPGLYFQGDNAINSGNGNVFGDGLRCAGGNAIRLEIQHSSGGAATQTTISIATKGEVSAGDTKRYQLWYRDAFTSICGPGMNLSNGYEITWTP